MVVNVEREWKCKLRSINKIERERELLINEENKRDTIINGMQEQERSRDVARALRGQKREQDSYVVTPRSERSKGLAQGWYEGYRERGRGRGGDGSALRSTGTCKLCTMKSVP